MKILGHGVDLVNLTRLSALLSSGTHVPEDWLTQGELALVPEEEPHRVAYLGGRIAAKEAVTKAMRTGFSGDVSWADVEILRDEEGAPVVHLHGSLLTLALQRGVHTWFLSLSHTDDHAIGSAIAVGGS